jgi:hypothetical protein
MVDVGSPRAVHLANSKAACLLEVAATCLRAGDVRTAKKHLRAAEADLRKPLQWLPAWVQVGERLVFKGLDGVALVLKVESVDLSRPWSVRCTVVGSPNNVYSLNQERGPRFWRKYRYTDELDVVSCLVCGRDKWRGGGRYERLRTRATCQCVEDAAGRTVKAGPAKESARCR